MQRVTRAAEKKILPNKIKKDEKHVVFALDDSEMIKLQAEEWVSLKNKYYKKRAGREFKPNEEHLLPYRLCIASLTEQPIFRDIQPSEVLYVYCHGYVSNDEKDLAPEDTKLWIKNFNKISSDRSIKKAYNPAEFLHFLIEQGLNVQHKKLKIAACYSDKFAIELFKISRDMYKEMSIVGYKGQLIVTQGKFGEKFAGLYPDKDGSLLEIIGEHTLLNSKLWALDKNNPIKFSASRNRVICSADLCEENELKQHMDKASETETSKIDENKNTADVHPISTQQEVLNQELENPDLDETEAMEQLRISPSNNLELQLRLGTTNKTNSRERFGWIEPSRNSENTLTPRQGATDDIKIEKSNSVDTTKNDNEDDSNDVNIKPGLGH